MNIDLLLNLLITLLTRASDIGLLIQTAQNEGRDVTDDELNALVAKDAAARSALEDAIAAARNPPPPIP